MAVYPTSMVQTELALSVLQLVALSLPAFAILLELMVESKYAYANRSVLAVALSFAMIVLAGVIVLTALLLTPLDLLMTVALLVIDVGLVGMLAGIYLIGLRTRQAQERLAE